MDPSETALPARPFPCCSVAEGVVVTLDGPLAAPGFAPQGLRRALHARARLILEKAKKVAGGYFCTTPPIFTLLHNSSLKGLSWSTNLFPIRNK